MEIIIYQPACKKIKMLFLLGVYLHHHRI